MAEIIRVPVPLDSHSNEALEAALSYARAICEKVGASDVILLTHTKHQLDHTAYPAALAIAWFERSLRGRWGWVRD